MLNKLISLSLRYRKLVMVLAIALVAASAFLLPRVPLEVFPELNAPTVTILTEAPGYAAEEVELAVTLPLETGVNGLPGIRRVRSSSLVGLSIVWAEFDFDTDIYQARQFVSERLAQARSALPDNVGAPTMGPVSSIAGEIMLVALTTTSSDVTPLELRRVASFDLRTRLLSVEGVAQVTAMGGELPEFQIHVRPADLRLFDLAFADVVDAARAAHATTGGGFLAAVDGEELAIRPLARAGGAEDLASTPVGDWQGTPITLDRVADVGQGAAPKRGTGSTGGRPAVILVVQKAPERNTLELTRAIDAMLDDFQATLPSGLTLERDVFRQADFVTVAIRNVLHSLRDGVIFLVVVLFLFLLNFRTTLITLTALPLSLGSALLLLHAFGATLNVMTLAGIAVAVGSLVDDAIVDVENVFRRLRENAHAPLERQSHPLRVVYEASVEIRSSIVLATAVIVLVFVPLFFLSGVEGRFFRPLGLSYVLSLMASLVVAMTVTPVLCYWMLGRARLIHASESRFVLWLKRVYDRALDVVLRVPKATMCIAGLLVALAIGLGSTFGSSFLPDFNEGSVTVFLNLPPGTSLTESDRVANHLEGAILRIPGVATVTRRTGRAEDDEHAEPVSASEIEVRLDAAANPAEVRERLHELFRATPGITAQLGGPIAHRLSHILSGTPAAVAIKIYGDDLPTLRAMAKEIEAVMSRMPGVVDLVANREVLTNSLPVEFDRRQLAVYGMSVADAAQQLESAFLGANVATIFDGASRSQVVVRLAPEARERPEDVEAFLLRAPDGALVPIHEVADVSRRQSPAIITRERLKRKAVVSCNVAEGENLGDLVARIRREVTPIVAQHPGTFVEYGGQFEAQEEAGRRILWAGLGVLLVIVLLLYGALRSMRPVVLILLNLPLALVGGVLAIYLDESPNAFTNLLALFGRGTYVAPVLSIAAIVGFIGLAGIACRNGLLLITHCYHLMEQEGLPVAEAIRRGSRERLVPILMTALSSALALVPIVLAKGEIGTELQRPLAVVIMGGLVSSTFLNLLVLPAGLAWFGGSARRPGTGSEAEAAILFPTHPTEIPR